MKFRKKPVVIEAFQYFSDIGDHTSIIPVWFNQACIDGTVFAKDGKDCIKTLEGEHVISDGDWVIKGVQGELYACKPDIFDQTYEPVE